jgi:hypothetical protein
MLLSLLIASVAWAELPELDRVEEPISADVLAKFSDGLLAGDDVRYGLYGQNPVRWLEKATGDSMLARAKSGELPEDKFFKHSSFVYGSYWDNCRRYYAAYRVTGDPAMLEQLRQYKRYMDWILANRPWLVLPAERREPRPQDPVASIPHEPAASSVFIGHALSARLTLQIARMQPDMVTKTQRSEAEQSLKTIQRYMDSWVDRNGPMDEQWQMPKVAAQLIRTTPYNQSFMYYSVLGLTATALADLDTLTGDTANADVIALYRRITRRGVDDYIARSNLTEIGGKSYFFNSYTPKDLYNPGRQKGPVRVDGNPIFRYPEDVPHSQSSAWNLVLLWETDAEAFGVTEKLLAAIGNTHVDHVLHGKVPLTDGTVGPPARIMSPWLLEMMPEKKWKRHGKPSLAYCCYLPWRRDLGVEGRALNGRAKKEMGQGKALGFLLYARYLQARRTKPGLLHLQARAK